jgi:quercetin dioxygenase-like cupin family protein
MDVPDSKYTTVVVIADIPAGAAVARHTHPGVESAYVVDGDGKLTVDGIKEDVVWKPGVTFQVAPNVPHSAQGGSKATKIMITYTVEKGKPLASPA